MRNPVPQQAPATLIQGAGIVKTYQTPDHAGRLVLDHLDFALAEGEIVAILGKSGSGKSTFLRILAGLTQPTNGTVTYRGREIYAPAQGIAMVFQSFALFPWLTVLGNVELGLEALGVPRAERRQRAIAAIDLIGLDGFESAYPKELSGGMRQRVGFARALVVNPDVLLLDEPFSALDVLTAETLRGDIIDLWLERRVPTKGIIIVSHNIEEAVELADRIIIFGSDPAVIRADIPVAMPRPRDWASPAFRRLVDEVYTLLTTVPGREGGKRGRTETIGLGYRLPDASIQQLSGLLETLADPSYGGRADLPRLAEDTNLATDDLVVLIEALQLLGLAHVGGGDIDMMPAGTAFAAADLLERKHMFAEHLMRNIPLVAHIRRVLDERPGHSAPEGRFLAELEDHLSEEEAQRVLETVINWGRYAELFAYDYDSGVLSLEIHDQKTRRPKTRPRSRRMIKPESRAFIVLLGALTMVNSVSIDIILPALPALGLALAATPGRVQLTLSLYVLGFAAGQLVSGPLSDRFGRRRILLAGLSLYTVTALACAASQSIGMLVAGLIRPRTPSGRVAGAGAGGAAS